MKLIGKLKDKIAKAKTSEGVKEDIIEAGMKLTDDELEQVSGGWVDERAIAQQRFNEKLRSIVERKVPYPTSSAEHEVPYPTSSAEYEYRALGGKGVVDPFDYYSEVIK